MSKYEYKFVHVPIKHGFKVKSGDTFEEAKKVIESEANEGWRLKQVVVPLNEKAVSMVGQQAMRLFLKKKLLINRY